MDQEPPDELSRGEVHGLHSVSALDAIVFPSEGYGVVIGVDQAVVRDRHPVRVSAEICQTASGPPKGGFV